MKLKKGKYYVGDPCYIFDKSWSEVLNSTNYFNEESIVKVFGKECAAGGTAYGDGVYTDNFGREYFVDAGMIGVLPVSLLNKDKKETVTSVKTSEGMHIVDFKDDFEVSVHKGVFRFGDIVIDTANDKDDEDDEW